jgi:hypothetical protein
MLLIILFFIGVSIISASILAFYMISAPSGWEDEGGFHAENKKTIKIKSHN